MSLMLMLAFRSMWSMCCQASSAWAVMPAGNVPSAASPGVPAVNSQRAWAGTSTASLYVPICRAIPISWRALAVAMVMRGSVAASPLCHVDRRGGFGDDRSMASGRALPIALIMIALASAASAQGAADFPSRPVKIVVPFAAGGPTDVVARILADLLAARWNGQSVVIE